MEYFVIGEREIVLAFGMIGIHGTVATTKTEILSAFNRVTGREIGDENFSPSFFAGERPKILIMTEDAVATIEDEVLDWQKRAKSPLIVEVPGIRGHLKGRKSLTEAIRQAIGINI